MNFKNEESYYYKKPDLEQQGYNMGSRAGATPYYANNATDTIIERSRSLGKIAHEKAFFKESCTICFLTVVVIFSLPPPPERVVSEFF